MLQSLVIQRECLWTEAPLLDHLSGPLAIGLDDSNRLRQRRWTDQVRPRRRILAGGRLRRRGLSWSSTSRPPGRSASMCRRPLLAHADEVIE